MSTRVGVAGVGPFPTNRIEIPTGFRVAGSPEDFVAGYRAVCSGGILTPVAMAISVPVGKLERLRDLISEWPSDREVASEDELRSSIGQLLHLCEVVRPGKYLVVVC